MHACMHTYIHKHTHTHIYIYSFAPLHSLLKGYYSLKGLRLGGRDLPVWSGKIILPPVLLPVTSDDILPMCFLLGPHWPGLPCVLRPVLHPVLHSVLPPFLPHAAPRWIPLPIPAGSRWIPLDPVGGRCCRRSRRGRAPPLGVRPESNGWVGNMGHLE